MIILDTDTVIIEEHKHKSACTTSIDYGFSNFCYIDMIFNESGEHENNVIYYNQEIMGVL